jgi:hypothetical protein
MEQEQEQPRRPNPFLKIGAKTNRRNRIAPALEGYEPYSEGPQPWTQAEIDARKAGRKIRNAPYQAMFGEAGPRKGKATWNTLNYNTAPNLTGLGDTERVARAQAELENLKQGVDERIYMIAKLVGDYDLTLKQNKSVRTLKSAKAWINQNEDRKRLYYAQLEDIDGDGVDDDVVVRSRLNHRPVWINTWSTTGGTRFTKKNLIRDEYYDKYPSYYERLDAPSEEKFTPFYFNQTQDFASAYTKFQRAIGQILKSEYGLTKQRGERLGDLAKRRAQVLSPLYRGWVEHLISTNKIPRPSSMGSLKRVLNELAEKWDNQVDADAQAFAYENHATYSIGGGGGASGGASSAGGSLIGGF